VLTVHDRSAGDDHRDLVPEHRLRRLVAREREVLVTVDAVELVLLLVLADELDQPVADHVATADVVDQAERRGCSSGVAVHRGDVGVEVLRVVDELLLGDPPCGRDVGEPRRPEIAHPLEVGLARLRRHRIGEVGLDCRLVLADAEDVPVHLEAIERVLEVQVVAAEAGDRDLAHAVHVDLVGVGREVVCGLRVVVGGGDDRLALGLEGGERRADLLQLADAGRLELAEIEHQDVDALIVAGALDGLDEIAQQRLLLGTAGDERRQRWAQPAALLDDRALRCDDQRVLVGEVGTIAVQHEEHDTDHEPDEQHVHRRDAGGVGPLPQPLADAPHGGRQPADSRVARSSCARHRRSLAASRRPGERRGSNAP
jgi:hypothetical protein